MSDHQNVYGICENLCRVPIYSKDQVDEKLIEAGTIKYNAETDMIMIYDGTTWHDWASGNLQFNGKLYDNGTEQATHAGQLLQAYAQGTNTYNRNNNYVEMRVSSGNYEINGMFENKVDLTAYSKLILKCQIRQTSGTIAKAVMGVKPTSFSGKIEDNAQKYHKFADVSSGSFVDMTYEFDISDVIGEMYVFVGVQSGTSVGGAFAYLNVKEVYLER